MKLRVIHTAREAEQHELRDALVVLIDALRATTVMVAAFASRARRIYPARGVDEAHSLRDRMPGAMLFGERHGVALPGFDGGNSPVELGAMNLAGRDLVLTTTNGTRAAKAAEGATYLVAASLTNVSAVVRWVKQRINADREESFDSIAVVCAGTNGEYSIDDVYVAGRITAALRGSVETTDDAHAAAIISEKAAGEVINPQTCAHAAFLRNEGLYDDVEYLLEGDRFESVPLYDDRGYFFEATDGISD